MIPLTANDIINIIESVAPLQQQEGWDNSGLQIGSRATEVDRVLLCTDITDEIVEEAVNKNCRMVISHHPLLFHGLKTIEGNTRPERCAIEAIKHDIVLYSSHTAMDVYLHGVSGKMAKKLGIRDYRLLSTTDGKTGLGVIGTLPEPLTLQQFLSLLKKTFLTNAIRYVSPATDKPVSVVALCGGAGSEFLQEAIAQKADAFVSADFRYHEMQAADGRIAVFDIGHFESEQFTKEIFRDLLNGQVQCLMAENDKSPIKIY